MKVLNLGSLNIDKVYQVPHIVRPKETIRSGGFAEVSGGKGLNQSVALAKAGGCVYHAGAIGADGGFLIDIMKEAGVETGLVQKLDGASGQAIIQVDEAGQNCIVLFTGANERITKEYVDQVLEQFTAGDLLLLQNEITNSGYAIDKAKEKGMLIAVNPSPVNERLEEYDMSKVDFIIANEIEGQYLSGADSDAAEVILPALSEKYPDAALIVTFGENGSVYQKGDELIRQPIFKVQAVDTTAAGDTFTGYFLAGVAEGLSPRENMRRASAASALAVTKKGAAPSIPARAEVEAFLNGQ